MPRQTHSYRRHQCGQAIATFGGKTVYLGPHGSEASKAEYRRRCAEYKVYGRVFLAGEGDISINEVLLAFMKEHEVYYRKNGKPTSEIGCLRVALRYVKRLYGHTLAREFGPRALKTCRGQMIEDGLARTTINDHVHRIRRVFAWAAAEEMLPGSVADDLKKLAGLKRGRSNAKEMPPVRPVSREHVDKVLPLVSAQVAAMIELQWLTGMRPGEVIAMRGVDIDRSEDDWIYRPAAHKTDHLGRERFVVLSGQSQEIVQRFLRAHPRARLFQPRDAEQARNARRKLQRRSPMTPSQAKRRKKATRKRKPAEHYTNHSYRRCIVRACEKAEIKPWTPHQLRHSAATRIRKQFGVEASRLVLGHSKLSTTEIYAERDIGLVRQIMRDSG